MEPSGTAEPDPADDDLEPPPVRGAPSAPPEPDPADPADPDRAAVESSAPFDRRHIDLPVEGADVEAPRRRGLGVER